MERKIWRQPATGKAGNFQNTRKWNISLKGMKNLRRQGDVIVIDTFENLPSYTTLRPGGFCKPHSVVKAGLDAGAKLLVC